MSSSSEWTQEEQQKRSEWRWSEEEWRQWHEGRSQRRRSANRWASGWWPSGNDSRAFADWRREDAWQEDAGRSSWDPPPQDEQQRMEQVEARTAAKPAATSSSSRQDAAVEARPAARREKVKIGPRRGKAAKEAASEKEEAATSVEAQRAEPAQAAPCPKKKRNRWWHKLDGDCPISLGPLCELEAEPFALEAVGSSKAHYFEASFLACFLVSSCDFIDPVNRRPLTHEECTTLDNHLKRNYPDRVFTSVADTFALLEKNLGRVDATASQQREATALLQHLFQFGSRRADARGRAILYQEANFTVVDDDEVLTTMPRPASAAPSIERVELFPSLPGGNPNSNPSRGAGGSTVAGRSAAWGPGCGRAGVRSSGQDQSIRLPGLPGAFVNDAW